MFLMWTYEQLSKMQINALLFQLFVTIFTFCKAFWGYSLTCPHLEAVLDYLSVAWSVFWKLRKRGARVCTVIVRVGRVWNTLWYLCLRCLYIRNGGGLDFSGRAFNRPISYVPQVVWTCLPSALPFTIDQILSTPSGKRNWVEALGQSSSKSPQELSGHRKVYTGGAQRVEIWGCWLVLCQLNISSSERREPQLRKCLQAE